MKWKNALKWFLELLITSICGDLLLDWAGTASKLSRAMPIIDPFVPHLAIAGIGTIVVLNIPFFRSMCPSEKFGAEHEKLVRLSDYVNGRVPSYSDSKAYDYAKQIIDICCKFDIAYLPLPEMDAFKAYNYYEGTSKDMDKLKKWGVFADDIGRCSGTKDLSGARNLIASRE